jgi:hypothetical protein
LFSVSPWSSPAIAAEATHSGAIVFQDSFIVLVSRPNSVPDGSRN